jgi:hypothetical protein
MFYKITKSLFRGKYQHKIVLVCSNASLFRGGDTQSALSQLQRVDVNKTFVTTSSGYKITNKIKSQEELDYAIGLANIIAKMQDFDLRVENPWISIYTNELKDIKELTKLNKDNVKYISSPDSNSTLEEGTVIMPKMPYDYRITLGKTTQSHPEFINWATSINKLKLTKSCVNDLNRPRSWGGTHFYVKGDNVLLMAKMHLGGSISKIERIIKPTAKA